MKKALAPSKFYNHVEREILDFIEYQLRFVNPRSPSEIITDVLSDISKKSGGIIKARLGYKSRKVSIKIKIPCEWTWQLEEEESDNVNQEIQ